NYAPKHDPFLYFSNIQTAPGNLCTKTNVDYAANFATDLAANTYRYMWITPNLINDGHDPSGDRAAALKASDTWLKNNLPAILASPGYQNGGVVLLTWDEGEGLNNHIPMIIISKKLKMPAMRSAATYDHSSYCATVEDLFGLPRLAKVTTSPSML